MSYFGFWCGSTFVQARDFYVIRSDPKLLVLGNDISRRTARFISAHVLCPDKVDERKAFFNFLGRYCASPHQISLFADATSRPDIDDYVGYASPCVREAVHQCEEFFDQHELSSTFCFDRLDGLVQNAWVAPQGGEHTIDYVAFKSHMAATVNEASVRKEIDHGHKAEDHWPSCVCFDFEVSHIPVASSGDRKIHTLQLNDQTPAQAFRILPGDIPSPNWNVPLHEHSAEAECAMPKAFSIAFPMPVMSLTKLNIS